MTNKEDLIGDRLAVIRVYINALPFKFTLRVPLNADTIEIQRIKLGVLRQDLEDCISEAMEKNILANIDKEYIEGSMQEKGWPGLSIWDEDVDFALDIDLGVSRCEYMDDAGTNF